MRLADQFLSEGEPEKAREQLRHIFGRAPEFMRDGYFASQVFIVLEALLPQVGRPGNGGALRGGSPPCVTAQSTTGFDAQAQADRLAMLFSVIVPTYNRLPILKKCLSALEAQTLASTDFEVIVIDDGSSDGTEELLTHYRPAIPLPISAPEEFRHGRGPAQRGCPRQRRIPAADER